MNEQIAALEARVKHLEDLVGITEAADARKLREDIIQVCLNFGISYARSKKMGRSFFNDGFTPEEVRAILLKRGATEVIQP